MRKRNVLIFSGLCFVLLLACTIISTFVYDALLPRVTAWTPEKGLIQGEEYRMLVPISSVYSDTNGNYVFRLKEVNGRWKVERCSVRVEAQNEEYAAISRTVLEEIQVAVYPSIGLNDGDIVKIE